MLARHLHSLLLIVLAELRFAGFRVFDFLLPRKPSLQRTKALSMECERLLVLKPSPIGHDGTCFEAHIHSDSSFTACRKRFLTIHLHPHIPSPSLPAHPP